MWMATVGSVMQFVGTVMVVGGAVTGVEEALNDMLRSAHRKQLDDDVQAAVVRAANKGEVVNIVVF